MAQSTRSFKVYSLYSETESFETRALKGSETLLSGLMTHYLQVEHMDNHMEKLLEVKDGGHMSENLTFL